MALTDNLVSYWKLDESSGNAADSHGSNTLTNSSVTYAAGIINNGGVFVNALSSKLAVTATGLPTGSATDFTMQCWWRGTTPVSDGILAFGSSGTTGAKRMILIVSGNAYFGGQSVDLGSGYAINDGNWHHLVFVRSGNNAEWFVDGASRATSTNMGSLVDADAVLRIGCRSDDTNFVTGTVDECAIWSRAITSAEVTSLYNGGSGLAYPLTTSSIKTLNGLAYGSVKTRNGLAKASIKTINGLA
jgi:hypothetical protein